MKKGEENVGIPFIFAEDNNFYLHFYPCSSFSFKDDISEDILKRKQGTLGKNQCR